MLSVVDDDTKNTSIDEEKEYARSPESRNKGRTTVELKLKALLEPGNLAHKPEQKCCDPNGR